MTPDQRFYERIRGGHRTFRRRRSLEAAWLSAAVFVPVLAVGLGLGMLLRYRPLGGWIVPSLALAGLVGGLVLAVRFGLRRRLSHSQFLRHLERRLGLHENELVNAEEMEQRTAVMEDPLGRGLAALAVRRGEDRLQGVSFARLAPALHLRRPLAWVTGGIAALLLLYAISPTVFGRSATRLVRPGTYDLRPVMAIRVMPGNTVVERGASLRIEVALERPEPDVRLLYRRPAGAWKTLEMNPAGAGGPDAGAGESGAPGSGETPATEALSRDRYDAVLVSILETTEYAVIAGDARSTAYRIDVVEPLRATGYRKRVEFPAYTGLTPISEITADGHVSALVGSRLTLGVLSSRSGARGSLRTTLGQEVLLEPVGDELVAALPVTASAEFQIDLEVEGSGGSRWTSEPYRIEAVQDRLPTLYQLQPDREITLPADMKVHVEVDCLDDFGLRSLQMVWRRNDREEQRVHLSRWEGNHREARVLHPWNLEEAALVPGDVVTWHLELTDNDAVTGPKTTVGPENRIRFPSFDEIYAAVQEERDEQVIDAREALELQKELSRNLAEVERDLKQSKELSWEQQEQLKDLASRQEQIAQQVEQLAESLDQSFDRMQQANLFTPEMLEKVQQINQMVQEIQSPEFRDYLQKLQDALRRFDRNAVNQALDQLQLTQQELERSLDRTLQMLQQLQREEKLDQLIQQAERLAEEQRRLNEENEAQLDQTDREPPREEAGEEATEGREQESAEADAGEEAGESEDAAPEDQASASEPSQEEGSESETGQPEGSQMTPEQAEALQKKQQALREELEKLREEMEKLRKEAEEQWKALQEQMEERKAEQQLQAASKQMEQASQAMGQCNKPSSLKFGRQAQESMEMFAQQMRQAQAQMRGDEQEEVTRQLYAISNRLVGLSQAQERLLQKGPGLSTRDLAREEQRLSEAARGALDDLYELGRQSQFITPELGRVMGQAVRNLAETTQAFAEGNRGGGMTLGSESTASLDATVLALLNANQQMCSACGGASNNPMARMQSLSGQQETLNADMQRMLGQSMGGQRLTPTGGEGDRLLQMAARQEMIRRGLQELQDAMGERSDILGRLDGIGDDMEDVVEEMRHRGADERILRRQERILSRLLTAQRSLRKQGQKEERVSRPGVNPGDRVSPGELEYGAGWQEALRRGILRGSQDPVPGDYRRLVETYFRSLRGAEPAAPPEER